MGKDDWANEMQGEVWAEEFGGSQLAHPRQRNFARRGEWVDEMRMEVLFFVLWFCCC
jgi:hypothetical protein